MEEHRQVKIQTSDHRTISTDGTPRWSTATVNGADNFKNFDAAVEALNQAKSDQYYDGLFGRTLQLLGSDPTETKDDQWIRARLRPESTRV